MNSDNTYDVIVIGGGLAGLSLAIMLARKQYRVLILEKENYPKHKVCGEYISMESKSFLRHIGVPVDDLHLPVISRLQVTDTRGNEVNELLPLGGFGISRYRLDDMLANLAQEAGATLLTKTKADEVQYMDNFFNVHAKDQVFKATLVCGAWGKRSSMDVKMHRSFIRGKNTALNNYLGVKYHIRYPWPEGRIALHNFTNGYCGVSPVEDDKLCLCYLTTAANLHNSGNDIKKMEQDMLMKNPWLNDIFSKAEFLYDTPLTISQISFQRKEQVLDHILLLGDAAGMITPLCGNGMSMAFHAAKMSNHLIDNFLQGSLTRREMETEYVRQWKSTFSSRVSVGRMVQSNFGKDRTTSFFLKAAKRLPFLRKTLIIGSSGKPF